MPTKAGASPRRRSTSSGSSGRVTQSKRAQEPGSGRYTPPVPRIVKRSPRWYPWMLLGMLITGVAAIILNYTEVAPASPDSGYLVGGILLILVAALLSTRYR